jgi:hypothetical protein
MNDDLASAFGITAVDVGCLLSSFFYTYSVFALVSGAALDRFGARAPVPIGAAVMAIGALLFVADGLGGAQIGRRRRDWRSRSELHRRRNARGPGGRGGRFHRARPWGCALASGVDRGAYVTGVIAICVLLTLRRTAARRPNLVAAGGLVEVIRPYRILLANPQSWLCALCAGCLSIPTTIGALIWRVPFYTSGLDINYRQAVLSASMVPPASGGSDLTASAFRHVGLLGSSRC